VLFGFLAFGLAATAPAQQAEKAEKSGNGQTTPSVLLPEEWVKVLNWRSIGPANMSGRITAVSVYAADPKVYWIATASGGLLKTVNNGITFEHQFDREATVSIGDVCVAPSNKNIVWVGTGENNPRNSVSYGDGVYKSTNGGKTWTNMGLKKTFQIGKIVIDPKNPDIVYVGALGRLYGANPERGLFKTTDGGKTWDKVLYVDEHTGVLDMRMHPTDPQTIIAATWERKRDEFDAFLGGVEGDQYGPIKNHTPGTALYKTTDGGKSWKKLANGLPTAKLGRIGLDWYVKNPNIVYAIIDTEKSGMGPPRIAALKASAEKTKDGIQVKGVNPTGPAGKAGVKPGDVIKAVNGKPVDDVTKVNTVITAALREAGAGQKVTLSIARGDTTSDMVVAMGGGKFGGKGGAFGGGGKKGGGGGGFAGVAAFGALGEDVEGGVKLTRILNDSPAEKAQLEENDVIRTVDKKPVDGFQALLRMIGERNEGDKVTLRVLRGADEKNVVLEVGSPTGGGRLAAKRPFGSGLGGQEENTQDEQGEGGYQSGGLFMSSDAGETWTRINSINPRPMYFSQVRVDPSDNKYLYVLGVSQYRSRDGGKTFESDLGRGNNFGKGAGKGGAKGGAGEETAKGGFGGGGAGGGEGGAAGGMGFGGGVHADGHALWINPSDGEHMIIGCDGGFYTSYDRGAHWDHLNTAALGQFYHVAVDSRLNYKVYGGLQDNGSWGGPSRTRTATGPVNEDWFSVGGGDGFVCRVDPNDPDQIYAESQGGAFTRTNLRTGERASFRPRPVVQGKKLRFNWNSPFILSHHNSKIYYCAGNYVFKSLDRGNDLQPISPEITASEKGSATALSESPRNQKVLWAGTDDGMLWVTRDGGGKWVNVSKNVPLPGPRASSGYWVATIEASRVKDGRCYVCFDAHRSDDDEPYVFVTEDYGQTWKSIRANLPWGSTRCLREDITNPNLLYCGTEFGIWASVNRGEYWTRINNNLPTVAVHEVAIHPTAGEIVAATHGRSIWIVDVTPLRQATKEAVTADAHLFKPQTAVRWQQDPRHGGTNRRFVGQNPPTGAQLYYSLTRPAEKVSLKVVDVEGKTVAQLRASTEPGLHRVPWNLALVTEGGGFGGMGKGGFKGGKGKGQPPAGKGAEEQPPPLGVPGFTGGRAAPPGTYRVLLTVDGREFSQVLRLEADPSGRGGLNAADNEGDDE
jgi:photosystem II stability/assembly factor-like uncharacterized protein